MPNYRRVFVPGGTWFFTVNLLERGSTLLTAKITDLNDAIQRTQARFPFEIDALVVLPGHLHAISPFRRTTRIIQPAGAG